MVSQRVQYWGPYRLVTRARQLGWRRLPEYPWRAARRAGAYIGAPIHRRRLGRQSFTLAGTSRRYFVHDYTTTWRNERAVEIPLALEFVERHRGTRLLEVGNVTRHFDRRVDHVVVDKYDVRPGVLSEDIETFTAAEPFDALLSISTLEHVGWDEEPRDPAKLERVLARLGDLVVADGPVLVTVPMGYNTALDALVRDDALPFAERRFLARRPDGTWAEVDADEALAHAYGHPFEAANAICIGTGLRPT